MKDLGAKAFSYGYASPVLIQQDILRIAKSACGMLIAQIERRPIETKRGIVPVSILNGQTL